MAPPGSIARHVAAALCVVLWSSIVCRAQGLRFDRLSTEHGLSQDIVTSIVQDERGFLWFGTEDGLNRYDGYTIRSYKHTPADSTSLAGDWIAALCVDRSGRLWVGTGAGLVRYDEQYDRFTRISTPVPSRVRAGTHWIRDITQDSSGFLWVSSNDGLQRYDERTGALITPHTGTDFLGPGPLTTDHRGIIWAGTRKGLYVVEPSTGGMGKYMIDGGEETGAINAGVITEIREDRQGILWIASSDSGLSRLDPVQKTVRRYTQRSPGETHLGTDIVHSVCIDKNGAVWVGTFIGLDRLDPGLQTVEHFRSDPDDPSSISGSRVYRVYSDRAGALWIGTYRGGVDRYDPMKQRFLHFRHRPGVLGSLSSNTTYALLVDQRRILWVGTSVGIDRLDAVSGQFQLILSSKQRLGGAGVTALHERRDGTLWAGTETGQLLHLTHDGRILHSLLRESDYRARAGLRTIRALHETGDGNLWIGTAEVGLLRLDTRTWRLDRNPLAGTGVRYGAGVWVIHEDHAGELWFGGWGEESHLVRFNPRTHEARQYASDPSRPGSLSAAAARTIYEDSSGTLWIGTWSGGLNRYDRQTDSFTTIRESDGLSNNFVKGILADQRGHLWISTERGLTRYDTRTRTFKRFTSEDGLQGDRFLSGSFAAGKDGWMYFGGENGFNAFHPDSIRDNLYVPPVVITSFRILDQPTSLPVRTGEMPVVHLRYGQDFFSFEFVALNFTQSQHNQYAYMMEGFDRDWIHSGSRRYAAYTHLGGGTYTFRVKASNNDGIWNTTGASVLVIIDPPVWLTWWFWSIAASVVLLSMYSLYRYRVRRLLEVERLRTRIASDLHDELASNLTSIAMFGKIILDDAGVRSTLPGHVTGLLDRITVLAQESVGAIRDIIWAIDPRPETLASLLQRFEDNVITECTSLGIRLQIEHPPQDALPPANLTPDQRKHFWLILKEAVHNAIKHAHCTTINIRTAYTDRLLTISIRDDGRGMPDSGQNTGKGQGTMRMRAGQLGGSLRTGPVEPSGTEVVLTVNL